MAVPRTVRTAPVARFKTTGDALLANFAAIRAQISVLSTQKRSVVDVYKRQLLFRSNLRGNRSFLLNF